MISLNDLTVTEINSIFTVHSEKGKYLHIKNREHYGISFCISGQITYTHNGKKFISSPNTVIFLPKGQSYTLCGDKEGDFPVINFECSARLCDTFAVMPLKNSTSLLNDYEYMKKMFVFGNSKLKIMSTFYDMISKINAQKDFSIITPSIKYLENNISNPNITNKMLAKMAGISEVYFRRLFLTEYGITPKQYIIDIRIQKAKQLLGDGKRKISEVSDECGFSSVYHFCRAFKEKAGITPTEYMKQNRIYKI